MNSTDFTGAKPTARAWLIVTMCCLAAGLDGFDLSAPAVTATQIRDTFGLTPAQLGTFFSAGTVGMMVGGAAGGIMSDRIGRKPMLLLTTLCFALGSLATAFAVNFEMLIVFRVMTGIGLGATLGNVITIASEAVPEAYRARAVAMVATGATFGGMASSLFALLPAVQEDWRVIYFFGTAAPLVLLPFLALLPSLETHGHEHEKRGSIAPLFAVERRSATLMIWGVAILLLISTYVLSTWLPTLLVSRGLDHVSAVRVQFVFGVAGVPGALCVGWLLDRSMAQRLIAVGAVFLGYMLALFGLGASPVHGLTIYVVAAAMGFMVCATSAVLYALAPALYPSHIRGTGVGMTLSVGRIGSIIGPLLAGFLLTVGLSASQVLIVLIPLVFCAGALAVAVARIPNRAPSVAAMPADAGAQAKAELPLT